MRAARLRKSKSINKDIKNQIQPISNRYVSSKVLYFKIGYQHFVKAFVINFLWIKLVLHDYDRSANISLIFCTTKSYFLIKTRLPDLHIISNAGVRAIVSA